MTINGTIHRTGFLLLCVIASALWVWTNHRTLNPRNLLFALLISAIFAMALVWLTVRREKWSAVTAPVYALLEGFVIGGLSARLEVRYPGIAIQAVALTFAICFSLLVAYRTGLIRVTEKFNRGLVAATSGVVLFYFANFVLALLGVRMFSALAGGVPGILASAIVVVIAGMNLVSDFDLVEQCVRSGLPKYMEWYASLGLIITLIWLYMEILRMLSKARKTQEST